MYSINEMVLYSANGVCKIDDITNRECHGQEREYYVLKPIGAENSTIYVPVENEALVSKIRKLVSVDEIHQIIKSIPPDSEICYSDDRQRQEKFKEALNSGDIKELIILIRTINILQKQQADKGRKLNIMDERFFKEAQKLLHEEIAFVMNINQDEVMQFIIDESEDTEEI